MIKYRESQSEREGENETESYSIYFVNCLSHEVGLLLLCLSDFRLMTRFLVITVKCTDFKLLLTFVVLAEASNLQKG